MNKKTLLINKVKDRPLIDEKAIYRQNMSKWIQQYIDDKRLLEENREVLKDYYKHIITESKCKSVNSYLNRIQPINAFGIYIKKQYNEVNTQDIRDFLFELKNKGLEKALNDDEMLDLYNDGKPLFEE